jgi:prepilin-type N-terminal cleavage/methylation domain-containing protein
MQTACRQSRLRARRAFTILELIVVLVVAGVIMAIALPKVHYLMVQQRISRASTAVENSLESAFAIASRNRRPIRITWSSTTMQLAVTDRAGTVFYSRTGLGQDPYGLTSSNVTFSQSPIEIYPNGLANSPLTITLTRDNVTKKVVMSRGGMVQIK